MSRGLAYILYLPPRGQLIQASCVNLKTSVQSAFRVGALGILPGNNTRYVRSPARLETQRSDGGGLGPK
jgi:hypothetical protein